MSSPKYHNVVEYLFVFLLIITLNFFIPRLMPGDPFVFLSSDQGQLAVTYSAEQVERYKAYYRLDQPLIIQYFDYIANLFKGNLGYSIYFNDSVLHIIINRMFWTLFIVLTALAVSCLVGVVLGCISAWYRQRLLDRALYFLMITVSEIPPFLTGIVFLFLLAAALGLFPLSGAFSSFAQYNSPLEKIADILYHAVLPTATLALARVGEFYLLSRNSMLSVLSKDYMRTARAKGLSITRIIFRHALKNALPPVITKLFLSLGRVLGGALLIEMVFDYPGLGLLMQEAVLVRDYPLIQGIFLFIACTVLAMNVIADIINKKLDPRVS